MPKKILIAGYFGFANTGDEAILSATLQSLRRLRSDLEFCVVSGDPPSTRMLHGVSAVLWDDLPAIVQQTRECDLMLLGGGGILNDHWRFSADTLLTKDHGGLTYYAGLPFLARLLKKPVMLYAVGVGPVDTDDGKKMTRLAFEAGDLATVRDVESLELLKSLDIPVDEVQVTADPAFSLTADRQRAGDILSAVGIPADKPVIGVCLRYWDKSGGTGWQRQVSAALDEYVKLNDCSIVFIPFQTLSTSPLTDDARIAEEVFAGMRRSDRATILSGDYPPEVMAGLAARCDLIVGMRLHSIIFAAMAGIPAVALVYDPKVSQMMSRLSMRDYALDLAALTKENFLAVLDRAWMNRIQIRETLSLRTVEPRRLAEENAKQAMSLLEAGILKPSRPAGLADSIGEFALKQTLLLFEKGHEADRLSAQAAEKDRTIAALSRTIEIHAGQLNDIYSSNAWKAAAAYYATIKKAPFGNIHHLIKKWSQGRKPAGQIPGDEMPPGSVASRIAAKLKSRKLKGVFIVTSAFAFNELFNQRVINLSKFLGQNGWGVVFVAWRWSKTEKMSDIGREVYQNVFQLPSDAFQEGLDVLIHLNHPKKYFVVEFPAPEFFTAAIHLRKSGYKIIYEIIDEWEAFHEAGQAAWFDKQNEEAFIMNANYLTAVSPPLAAKFSGIRKDIVLIPNGFDPALLGSGHQNIARRAGASDAVNIGYFGNLTDAWFDWEFVFNVLELAGKRNKNIHFRFIGFGAPDFGKRIDRYQGRIKLYGPVRPSKLYRYVKEWDGAIIPFKRGKLAEAVDPIKIYEYLYFGLPVIVRGIPHLKQYPHVNVVSDEEQFLDALGRIGKDTNELPGQFLADSTWEQRFTKFMDVVENERWMFL